MLSESSRSIHNILAILEEKAPWKMLSNSTLSRSEDHMAYQPHPAVPQTRPSKRLPFLALLRTFLARHHLDAEASANPFRQFIQLLVTRLIHVGKVLSVGILEPVMGMVLNAMEWNEVVGRVLESD